MKPRAMWLPFVVPDLDETVDFWERRLGLGRVDEWARDGERGVVLRASCGALVEFVQPIDTRLATARRTRSEAAKPPVTVALEVASRPEVWSTYLGVGGEVGTATRPAVYPRGHYGFTLLDPHGIEILVWAEKELA